MKMNMNINSAAPCRPAAPTPHQYRAAGTLPRVACPRPLYPRPGPSTAQDTPGRNRWRQNQTEQNKTRHRWHQCAVPLRTPRQRERQIAMINPGGV